MDPKGLFILVPEWLLGVVTTAVPNITKKMYCILLVQYSCLENPMDGGAWWAAVYGVTQSWARLK